MGVPSLGPWNDQIIGMGKPASLNFSATSSPTWKLWGPMAGPMTT